MAQVTNPNQQLYVVRISASSAFFVKQSEKYLDENAKKMWYKFPEGDRKRIMACRQAVNVVVNAGCPDFYGMKIANEIAKGQIETVCAEQDKRLREIDPTLHCKAQFLPLKSEAFTSGSLLDNLTAQIQSQIHQKVFDRIEKTIAKNESGGALTTKTKTALLSMLEKCKGLNIMENEGINNRIESMKVQINNNQLKEMRDEINLLLDETQDRFASIDMVESAPGTVAVETPDAALDDTKYDAVPITDDEIKPVKKSSVSDRFSSVEDF